MANDLFERFSALKKMIGGNYEKHSYEGTCGLSVQELNGITGISPSQKRILSELNFALQLSSQRQNSFRKEIDEALTILEKSISAEETLSKSACMKAEEALLPMENDAKEYLVLYAAHAHIDMNWMWGWQETVAVTLATFRTMLDLMNEYPSFTFSQSQGSVYKIVEEYDPEMMLEIQKRIREGRWEVTASAWVETDKNMPDTESLLHHVYDTRKYLREVWGVDERNVKVDFSPDTFGHSRFIPEINTFAGVSYYYHCRGLQDENVLYRYASPSGAEILAYKEPYWYNSGIQPDNGTGVFEIEKRCGGLKTSLIVYGVGDHGGGATRRDIEALLEMQNWPVFPRMRFGTLGEFFESAESVRDRLPVVNHELNGIFTGCYTTQSRIKLFNRRAEQALIQAETLTAIDASLRGKGHKAKNLEKGWQNTLFCHFHDIITGSCVQESREYAIGELEKALSYAQTESSRALERITGRINTACFPADPEDFRDSRSEGAGVGFGLGSKDVQDYWSPYGSGSYYAVPNPERGAGKVRIFTVYNTCPEERSETVEILLWDYSGDVHRLEVIDEEGSSLPFELQDAEPVKYWNHYYVRLLVSTCVPGIGYRTLCVRQLPVSDYPTYLFLENREETPKENVTIENEYLRAEFKCDTGEIGSLVNLENNAELLKAPAGPVIIRTENTGASAWRIGRYLGEERIEAPAHVTVRKGAIRSSVTIEQSYGMSKIRQRIYLDSHDPVLHVQLDVDWSESSSGREPIPLLTYRLPCKNAGEVLWRDVPAGMAASADAAIDVPALTFAVPEGESGTVPALMSDSKYGYRLQKGVLSVSLINTASEPDPYPERGLHCVRLGILTGKRNYTAIRNAAKALASPLTAFSTTKHAGKLPSSGSLLAFKADHSVLSGVSLLSDEELSIRFFENEGKPDLVEIEFPKIREEKKRVLADGDQKENSPFENSSIRVSADAYKLKEVKIKI